MNKMVIEQFNFGDIDYLLDLFIRSDKRHMIPLSYYEWRNNNFNTKNYVMKNKSNRIIGHYSIQINKFIYKGNVINIGLGQQAVIDPAYRNLENILELVNYAIQNTKNDLDLIIGFPNNNFYLVQERFMKWDRVDIFNSLEIKLKDVNNFKIEANNEIKRLSKDESQKLKKYNFKVNNQKINISVNYNYINWRFLEKPTDYYPIFYFEKNDRIEGYIVLKVFNTGEDSKGHIVNLNTYDDEIKDILISNAINYFKFLDLDYISIWPTTNYYDFFNKYNFCKEKSFNTNFYMKNIKLNNVEYEEFKYIKNWNLEMHLSDAF